MNIHPIELAQMLGINLYSICKKNEVRGEFVHEECFEKLKRLAKQKGIEVSCTRFGAPLGYVKMYLKRSTPKPRL